MTREKAIEWIKYHIDITPYEDTDELKIALNMAIKALEQEPFINKPCVSNGVCEHDKNKVLDKIRAEIEQLSTSTCTETCRIYIDADDFKENVLAILDKYKAETEVEDGTNK